MNIFENAKFGEIFVAKDGTRNSFCSFTKSGSDTLARLYREDWGVVICSLDGIVHSGDNKDCWDFDIIGKWEEINEEELGDIATIIYRNTYIGDASDAEIFRKVFQSWF